MNISPGRRAVLVVGRPPNRVTDDRHGTAVRLEPPDAEAVSPAAGSVYHLFDDAEFAGPMIGRRGVRRG